MARCPTCGLEANANFCSRCGTDLRTVPGGPPAAGRQPFVPPPAPKYMPPPPQYVPPQAPPYVPPQAPQYVPPQAPQYVPPQAPHYGPPPGTYTAPTPAVPHGPIWQGLVTLILCVVLSAYHALGLSLLGPGLTYYVLRYAAYLILPLGLTALIRCRPAGKLMAVAGVGLAIFVGWVTS